MVIHLGFVTTCLLDSCQRRSFRGWIAKGFVLLFYRDDTKTGAISAGGFHRIELADISVARPDLSLRAEIGFEPEPGFPGFPSPFLTVNIGWLGLQHLLVRRGCGYFPERLIERHIRTGDLQTVARAPGFDLPAWVLIREERDFDVIDPILEQVRAFR